MSYTGISNHIEQNVDSIKVTSHSTLMDSKLGHSATNTEEVHHTSPSLLSYEQCHVAAAITQWVSLHIRYSDPHLMLNLPYRYFSVRGPKLRGLRYRYSVQTHSQGNLSYFHPAPTRAKNRVRHLQSRERKLILGINFFSSKIKIFRSLWILYRDLYKGYRTKGTVLYILSFYFCIWRPSVPLSVPY